MKKVSVFSNENAYSINGALKKFQDILKSEVHITDRFTCTSAIVICCINTLHANIYTLGRQEGDQATDFVNSLRDVERNARIHLIKAVDRLSTI